MFALIAAVILFLDLIHVKLGGIDMVVLALFCLAVHFALGVWGPASWTWARGRQP